MKLDHPEMDAYIFQCPGCDESHMIPVGHTIEYRRRLKELNHSTVEWGWNGSLEAPTFTPSLLVRSPTLGVCHSFIRDGKIQFLDDCTHRLKGQTVDLADVE